MQTTVMRAEAEAKTPLILCHDELAKLLTAVVIYLCCCCLREQFRRLFGFLLPFCLFSPFNSLKKKKSCVNFNVSYSYLDGRALGSV